MLAAAPALLRAGTQSGCIMTTSDLVTQLGIERRLAAAHAPDREDPATKNPPAPLDVPRTLRWLSAGFLVHGPYVHLFYGWVDKLGTKWAAQLPTPPSPNTILARKTAVVMVLGLPLWLGSLFTFMGFVEAGGAGSWLAKTDVLSRAKTNYLSQAGALGESVWKKLETKLPQALLGGCTFWPVATAVNFVMVPLNWRVIYVAGCSGCYNCFLSWFNARDVVSE